MKKILLLSLISFISLTIFCQEFPNELDNLVTDKWWTKGENNIVDLNVSRDDVIAFAIYTISYQTLKMSVQFFPLLPNETRQARLYVFNEDIGWSLVGTENISERGWIAHFRIEDWDDGLSKKYLITHYEGSRYEGVIRKNPIDKDVFKIAALSCNSNKDRGLRENYVRNINYLDPDLVVFLGDQSYDHNQHTAAWIKFGLQFREVFRNRPCITIPDDHDVGQGNLWGNNGATIPTKINGSGGGYYQDIEYVKMVENSQTWHLPDKHSSIETLNGLSTYFTSFDLGGIDFAILEDRKFKSPPTSNDQNLSLLGEEQMDFLKEWGSHPNIFKVVLSATTYSSTYHLVGPDQNRNGGSRDTNGWPKNKKDEVIRIWDQHNAIHIGGDTHNAVLVQHSTDSFRNYGPWSFVIPASVNDYYNRWWWPTDHEIDTANATLSIDSPLPWVGDYRDPFNNRFAVHSYTNPSMENLGDGFGFIFLDKNDTSITFSCFPRFINLEESENQNLQYLGWPVHIKRDGDIFKRIHKVVDTTSKVLRTPLHNSHDILVYPTHFQDYLEIFNPARIKDEDATIVIREVSGKEVFRTNIRIVNDVTLIEPMNLEPGVYVINIYFNEGINWMAKLLKK